MRRNAAPHDLYAKYLFTYLQSKYHLFNLHQSINKLQEDGVNVMWGIFKYQIFNMQIWCHSFNTEMVINQISILKKIVLAFSFPMLFQD